MKVARNAGLLVACFVAVSLFFTSSALHAQDLPDAEGGSQGDPGRIDKWEDWLDKKEDKWDRKEDVRDRREDKRDKIEDIVDKREDVRDRREDYWDRREDIRDRKDDIIKKEALHKLIGKRIEAFESGDRETVKELTQKINYLRKNIRADRREDFRDRREDIWDRLEDRRDRREDVRDRHEGRRDRREDFRDRSEDWRDRREDIRDRLRDRYRRRRGFQEGEGRQRSYRPPYRNHRMYHDKGTGRGLHRGEERGVRDRGEGLGRKKYNRPCCKGNPERKHKENYVRKLKPKKKS